MDAYPHADPVSHQMAVDPPAGAQFVEFVEDQLHGRLHLLVRIADDFPRGKLDISPGDVEEQRAAVGLVQSSAF
jgi:hypothetical protein